MSTPSTPSKVYFTNFRTPPGLSQLDKLKQLILISGVMDMDFKQKFVAIKIHMGEPGNLSFLRPNYAKVLVDLIKERGGIPFLTDCATLYPGRRKHALEHLEAAAENGYSPATVGCPIIIGDGLKGMSDVEIPVEGATMIQTAKIGREIMEADIFISLNHFKGHECTGFGGAVKNIGMGCASRRGKMEQHKSGKPEVNAKLCVNCKRCAQECGQNAFDFSSGKAIIKQDTCVGCGRCLASCNFNAIYNPNDGAFNDLHIKMAEYTKAVLHGRPHFHVNVVIDISPYCDCHPDNDMAILPNVGYFVSSDPIAVDHASVQACLKLDPMPGSELYDTMRKPDFVDQKNHFSNSRHGTEWHTSLEHGEKLGIGSCNYQLITME